MLANCDVPTNSQVFVFNGDDAIAVSIGGTNIDVVGQIGVDPGNEWGAGLASTQDNTLRRQSSNTNANPGTGPFTPSADYDGYATDTFDGLGTPSANLPVELVSLTASADGSSAVVRWTTASETNNASFAIEALRGAAWSEVASATGRGTTSERADYEVRIEGLGAGRHTLRLVQRDLDGTATVAGTVELTIGQREAYALDVRGNATDAPMVGVVARESGSAVVTVLDVTGRTVARHAVDVSAGSRVEVPLEALASGVYVVRVTGRAGSAVAAAVVR